MDERVITLENARELQDILGHSLVKKARIPGHNTVPLYILLEELYIKISNGDILHIPEGFIWDLSSVPRLLWTLLPPDGDMEIGVIIHDYLYIHSNCFEYTQ